jgi:hypothetical protein
MFIRPFCQIWKAVFDLTREAKTISAQTLTAGRLGDGISKLDERRKEWLCASRITQQIT